MGLNASYRHFGKQTATAEDAGATAEGGKGGRDRRGQQPWRLNQAEKKRGGTKWDERGRKRRRRRKGRGHGKTDRTRACQKRGERSLSHSLDAPRLPPTVPPSLVPLYKHTKGQRGAALVQKRGGLSPLLLLIHTSNPI